MGHHDIPRGGRFPADCTTTGSFSDHGVDDGVDLVTRTYYRFREAGDRESGPGSFFDRLESAFVGAYLDAVDEPEVPTHVELAIDDARALTEEAFGDPPDADVRTEIVPAFYRRVAGFHCRYRP